MRSQRMTLALVASFGFVVFFGIVALLVTLDQIDFFDRPIIDLVQGWESEQLTRWMETLSWFGSRFPVLGITISMMVLFFLFLGHRKELLLLIVVVAGNVMLNESLKLVFHRARPTLHRIGEATGYSFPSGHSMITVSLYGIIAYLLWKHIGNQAVRTLLLLAVAFAIVGIGLSRVYLGVHYPSDVLAGYLLSGCWLTAAIWAYQRKTERRQTFRWSS